MVQVVEPLVVDALTLVENFIKPSTNVSFTRTNVTAQGEIRLEDSSGGEYAAIKLYGTTTTFTLPAAAVEAVAK